MRTFKLLFILLLVSSVSFAQNTTELAGSWKGDEGVFIFTDGYYSYASFDKDEFHGTHGGSYELSDGNLSRTIEFNTFDNETVGSIATDNISFDDGKAIISGKKYDRIDDGTPGELNGAWIITGRMRDGELNEYTPGARKTMKILSGKRFQWIAYNTETKEFMGTGGGTYSTNDGKYIENIDFFSRDQSRVGASLPFGYELKDGKWHHRGNSSKGDPIYEIWSQRKNL